ncbi:ABC transporter permease [Paenibacillus tarimensis]
MTKMRILTGLAYRFEVFAAVGTNLILITASVFLWYAAYGGGVISAGQAEGLTLNDMVTYTVMSSLIGFVFVCGVQNTLYNKIREGQIATDFYRPVPLLACYLADDIGAMIGGLANKALPLLVFVSLAFGPPLPASWTGLLLFLPSVLLSYAILWLLSALVGLVAFWAMELGNMGIVKDAIVRVLSGSLVPIWFFPDTMQKISVYLPFQYTYQTPLGIYIGVIGTGEAMRAMAIQVCWIAALYLLLALVWRRAKTKTLIQGG